LAGGEWIQFLDADDLIDCEKIASQMMLVSPETIDCVISCGWKRFLDEPQDESYLEEAAQMPGEPVDWLIQKYSGRGMIPLHAWLTPSRLIAMTGGWDTQLAKDQDGEFFDHIVCLAKGICHIPRTMAFYRSGLSGSVSGRRGEKTMRSCLTSIKRGSGRLLALSDTDEARRACAWSFKRIGIEAFPRYPAITREALSHAAVLGGSKAPVSGGSLVKQVQKIFGWRLARLLQEAIQMVRNFFSMRHTR
jgi:hypothetical protein